MQVLICEDDKVLLSIFEFTLKSLSNVNVSIAQDGKEAKAKLDASEFDLIITDITMPYYSGLDIIRYIRKDLDSEVPVIVVTANTSEKTMDEAKKLGVSEYMFKPINPTELLEYVRHFNPGRLNISAL
jgi:DNA-binding response OmpR family regulator